VRSRPPRGFERWRIGSITEDIAAYARDEIDAHVGSAAVAIVEDTMELVRRTQEQLGTEVDRFGLIHGDLHQENYFFHDGAVCAIDFDDCGWGWFAYDLAVPLSELRTRPDYEALARRCCADTEPCVPSLPIMSGMWRSSTRCVFCS